jgi:hypothetical protein
MMAPPTLWRTQAADFVPEKFAKSAVSAPNYQKIVNFLAYWSTRAAQSLLLSADGIRRHVPLDCLSR